MSHQLGYNIDFIGLRRGENWGNFERRNRRIMDKGRTDCFFFSFLFFWKRSERQTRETARTILQEFQVRIFLFIDEV